MIGNNTLKHDGSRQLAPPPPLDLQRHALFLDIDGTLLEIEQRPDLVCGDELLRGLLRELHKRLDGALAVISGRTIADIDRILGLATPCVSGVHGQEHRIGEALMRPKPCAQLDAAWETVRKLNVGDLLKVLVEHKGAAVAIHYRQAPQHGDLVRRAAEEIAQRHGLKVVHGRMVVEFLPPDASKSEALTLFMKTPAFAGRTPVAVGDDATDEDAFRAVRDHGGLGVQVGEERSTAANHRLENVRAVRSWLLVSLGRALA